MFSVMFYNDLTVGFLCAALGRVWDVWQMQKVLVHPFFVLVRNLPRSHMREQAPHSGVLELELEDVEKLDKTKGCTTTLRAKWKHEKSVTAAYWDPRGRSIVSTSYNNVLRSTSSFHRESPSLTPPMLL